jgi:hypothetical protein
MRAPIDNPTASHCELCAMLTLNADFAPLQDKNGAPDAA